MPLTWETKSYNVIGVPEKVDNMNVAAKIHQGNNGQLHPKFEEIDQYTGTESLAIP